MVWERYCLNRKRFSKTRILFIFFVYIFIHISANMSPFGLKFSQMILQYIYYTETSKLMYMYNWSFSLWSFAQANHSYPVPLIYPKLSLVSWKYMYMCTCVCNVTHLIHNVVHYWTANLVCRCMDALKICYLNY